MEKPLHKKIHSIADMLEDDKWEETKTLMEKEPKFRHGIIQFIRHYAEEVYRIHRIVGG